MIWCVLVWFLHFYIIYFKYAYFKHLSVLAIEALGLSTQNMKKKLGSEWIIWGLSLNYTTFSYNLRSMIKNLLSIKRSYPWPVNKTKNYSELYIFGVYCNLKLKWYFEVAA